MNAVGKIYKFGEKPASIPAFWCRDNKHLSYPYKSGMCSWHGGVDYSRTNAQAAQRAYHKRMLRLKSMNGIGQIFDANQIIGKTLFAAKPVPIKRYPSSSSPVVYTAPTGAAVGIVYSWVMDGIEMYWQFYDANGKAYYAKQATGYFSLTALKDQGAQTVLEVKQAQEEQNKPWFEKLFGTIGGGVGATAKTAILVIAGILIYKQLSK